MAAWIVWYGAKKEPLPDTSLPLSDTKNSVESLEVTTVVSCAKFTASVLAVPATRLVILCVFMFRTLSCTMTSPVSATKLTLPVAA